MKDKQFTALLSLLCQSDTFGANDMRRTDLMELIDNESKKRGYDDCWIAHSNLVEVKPVKTAKPEAKKKKRIPKRITKERNGD